MPLRRMTWLAPAVFLWAAGCGRPPSTQPAGTGAEAAAKRYCEALVRQEWGRAYEVLDPDSRAACDPARFARRAAAYCGSMGFTPDAAHVRSCEEHGEGAVAHVVYTSTVNSGHRSFKDGLVLRRGLDGWGVVLPARLRP